MKYFYSRLALFAGVAAAFASPADAAGFDGRERLDLNGFRYRIQQRSAFGTTAASPRFTAGDDNDIPAGNRAGYRIGKRTAATDTFKPLHTYGPAQMTGDLDGPGGERWYYTAQYDYDVIPADKDAGIWYDDYILKSFSFDIYNARHEKVGTVSAPMRYADDELRVATVDLAPVVSRHFFNTDDLPEIAVSLCINTKSAGMNHYRTEIYSVSDESGTGNDEPTDVIHSIIGDVVEGPATADGHDNFFISFMEDYYPDNLLDDPEASFWDYVTGARMDISIYGRADGDGNGPNLLGVEQIPLLQLPGDQESTPFMMSLTRGDKVYFVISRLSEPIWERYDDPINSEMVQREGNKLEVKFVTATPEGLTGSHTVSIDVEKDEEDYTCIASFFGVGDLRYKDDMLFDFPGTPEGRPALIVTRSNYNPSSDSSSPSYFVYDHEGHKLHDLGLYCDSALALSDVEGAEPQMMFVRLVDGQYVLDFKDIYSGKMRFITSSNVATEDGKYEQIVANLDRTPAGDSYKYAIELSGAEVDDAGDTYMRVLWLDAEGKFDHIDRINVGKDVMYGMLYISGDALSPESFHSDSRMEYLALVKRGEPGNVLSEDLVVAQAADEEIPQGKTLLMLTGDERGGLSGIVPDFSTDSPYLAIYYYDKDAGRDGAAYSLDIYDLPLDNPGNVQGVDGVADGSGIHVEGDAVVASGAVKVYGLDGALVREGNGRVSLVSLPAGVYVAASEEGSVKIYVK